jgi:crotonobetainyl-CoA:carnitine CoA-transferase CaiB-like acyl-CoA transferase
MSRIVSRVRENQIVPPPTTPSAVPTIPSALGPIRIADFSRVLAGPFATMLLADLGAEVVKVERPGIGDETRSWGPPWHADGTATYFESINRNKRSLVIDLSTAEGLAQARELGRSADVVVENFRPGLMDELGLGDEALREANPGLIFCSITGFGSQPEARHLPGYDLLVQALGGLMSITGSPDGPPQKVGVALVDVLAGLFATVGILAALVHRAESGRGQRIEVDLLSSLLAALINQATGYTAAGVVPERMGNRHPSVAPYEVFRCGEGELVVAVGNDRQFKALCAALGIGALAEDPRFATNSARVVNREAMVHELEKALAAGSAAEWAERLIAARVPAGVVNDIAGAFALAEAIGLDPTVTLGKPGGGEVRLPRNPIRLSETPPSYRLAPPALGEGGGGAD